MLKVLFLTRKWAPAIGGMETYSQELTNALAQICDLTVRALPGRKDGAPPALPSLLFFFISSIFFFFRQKRYDIIHIGDLVLWPLVIFSRMAHPRATYVITAYGLDIVYGARAGLLPFLYRIYLRLGVRLTTKEVRVIAISNATAQLCKDVGFKHIFVVPLGVSYREVCETSMEPSINDYVLFVGRLVKRKGAAWFARKVMPLLQKNIKMIVVGKKWDQTEWDVLWDTPNVEYLGIVSDAKLRMLRRNAIAVLMPNIPSNGTDIEGFGLTAVEAAADGGVLLASNIEGITDAVIEGKTGFLLEAENPSAWSNKIEEITRWDEAQRQQFIITSSKYVREFYSWRRVGENTLLVYTIK